MPRTFGAVVTDNLRAGLHAAGALTRNDVMLFAESIKDHVKRRAMVIAERVELELTVQPQTALARGQPSLGFRVQGPDPRSSGSIYPACIARRRGAALPEAGRRRGLLTCRPREPL
jgi:hypothetical protein